MNDGQNEWENPAFRQGWWALTLVIVLVVVPFAVGLVLVLLSVVF